MLPRACEFQGWDVLIVPADTVAGVIVGGFVFCGQLYGDFVADLDGEFVFLRVDGEDCALHASWAAEEGFDVIAAEVDAIDFPCGCEDFSLDSFAGV